MALDNYHSNLRQNSCVRRVDLMKHWLVIFRYKWDTKRCIISRGDDNDGKPTERQKSSSKRRLEEEGRLAIVSRNSEREYVRVAVPKTDEVKKLILESIRDNILFKACSHEELAELVEVFAPQEAPAGSTVIRQGDEGDAFYVMERGTIDVYIGEQYRVTLYSGASFGEIALLYNCPRSATLRTGFDCKLWGISRAAFRAITSQFKQRRTDAKVAFLKKVRVA